jgi:hypothetical protein
MSVNDICDCLKNDILGLKSSMISIYIQDFNELNISGRVLATCELDELKQASTHNRRQYTNRQCRRALLFAFKVLSMAFGDWVLFTNWVATKRDDER